MELDEATLFNQFMEETRNYRRAFFQRLEEKYVKNQNDSDVIDMKTLTVLKSKGQLKGSKYHPVPFGSISSYSCRKGRRILKILRRKVKIKRKCRLRGTIYHKDDFSTYATENSSLPNIKDCFVKLVKLDFNHISTSCYSAATIENKILNGVPKLVDIKFPKYTTRQTLSYTASPILSMNKKKYLPLISSEISLCDLGLRSKQHLSNDNGKSKFRSHSETTPEIKKTITDFKRSNIDKTNFCVELEEELSITDEIILSDTVNTNGCKLRTEFQKNSCNTFAVKRKSAKDIRLLKHERKHLLMNVKEVDLTGRRFYNTELNNDTTCVSLYNSFDNLNFSSCDLQNSPNLSSKIIGKLTPYEIKYLSRQSLGTSKKICSSSPSLQKSRISPLPCPAISKFTLGYISFPKSISPQISNTCSKNDCLGNSNDNCKLIPQIDSIGLKRRYNSSTDISSSYSSPKNISKRSLKRLKTKLKF